MMIWYNQKEQRIDQEIDEFLAWLEPLRKDHEYGTGRRRKRNKAVRGSNRPAQDSMRQPDDQAV